MNKLTGKFLATGDDGLEYTVCIYTDIHRAGGFEDPGAVVEGQKGLETSDGLTVKRLEKGMYQIMRTGVTLLSDSPDAP